MTSNPQHSARAPFWLRWLLPVLLVLTWLAIAGVGGPTFGRLEEVSSNDQASFLPASAEATAAQDWQARFRDSDEVPAVIVIENDAHEFVRRRSSLAHEMSHHLLEHGFPDTLLTEEHDRAFSPELEKEALFLSGELLVPEKACIKLAFKGADNVAVGSGFEVSTQFAQMRMKGARVLAANALRKQARGR